jgi:hypothetical protein
MLDGANDLPAIIDGAWSERDIPGIKGLHDIASHRSGMAGCCPGFRDAEQKEAGEGGESCG